MEINLLARENIQTLTPYQSARRIGGNGDVWLNANENPRAPAYLDEGFSSDRLNRYPECQPEALIQSYANYAGVLPVQVLTTRGADEGIELIMRTFCEPEKDSVLSFAPTYGMYKVCAQTMGIDYQVVDLDADWGLNFSEIENRLKAKNIKLIYLCRPNNPTGNLIPTEDVEYLLKLIDGQSLLVVDEAYIEYSEADSVVGMLGKYKNLIILRTLSKAFALAGLRCGFVLANEEVNALLLKVIAPYPVPEPVSQIAVKALSEKNIEEMKKRVRELKQIRDQFKNGLQELACVRKVFDSATNYLLIQFIAKEAVFDFLKQKGIVVRDQSTQPSITDCLRITIGTKEECDTVLAALTEFTLGKI